MKSTTASTPLRTNPRGQETSGDTLEQIRMRAYEIYEQAGREDGHDVDHWLQAEAEIIGTSARKAAA